MTRTMKIPYRNTNNQNFTVKIENSRKIINNRQSSKKEDGV